jgi:hypothetical protein
VIGTYPVQEAPEASGLVAGRRNPDVLYVLDDGPGTTSLLVISARNAKVRGRIRVAGLDGRDTEALAAGPCGPRGGSCLYIGDIGDNVLSHDSVSVLRLREPDLSDGVPGALIAARTAVLRYPRRPRNAEALLVDDRGGLLLITKAAADDGTGRAHLFVKPSFGDGRLRDLGQVPVPMPALPLAVAVTGNVVTGADSAPGLVALRTYDAVFEYRARSRRAALASFPTWPVTEVPAAGETQGEAVAYAADGCGLYTVGEGSGDVSLSRCR